MGPAGRKCDLVIFDCDGVLVDSEPLSIRVLAETLGKLGIRVTPGECYRLFLGHSLASVNATLRTAYGCTLSDAEIAAMRERLYDVYARELKPVGGVAEVLAHLGLPVCVASSSQPDRIRVSLALTGLATLFGANVFSASMVEHGKPAPDLFLFAANRMGVAPECCVVVEDSPTGIEAAKRAGMRSFAFLGGSHAAPAGLRDAIAPLHPSCIFDRMEDLPRLIQEGQP